MKGVVAFVLLLVLSACASTPRPDPRDQQFSTFQAQIGAKLSDGKITRKQAAIASRDEAHRLFHDPDMDEVWAYRVYLADQVEQGKMTLDEASFLDQREVNKVLHRHFAGTRPNAPQYRLPRSVTCSPNGLGGMRCQ